MWLFFLLCFLTIFMAGVYPANSSKNIKKYLSIIFFVFAILIGLRSSSVGDDTIGYINNFNLVRQYGSLSAVINSSRFEVGYLVYVRLLTMISDNAQILLIVTAIIVSFSFGRFIYRYSNNPWLSVLMFLTLDFFDTCMSSVRLSLAIAFLLFAYDGLIERRFIKTLIFTLIAASMHYTSIVFLILYPITAKGRSRRFYSISIIAGIVMFVLFDQIISLISRFLPQYMHYYTSSTAGYTVGATLAIALMIALWLLMYVFSTKWINYLGNKEINSNPDDLRPCKIFSDQLESVSQMAVWLGVLTLFLALNGTMLARFKYIFSASILLFFPNSIAKISNKSNRLIISIIFATVFILYVVVILVFRPEWGSTYPYMFFWQE